MFALLVQEPAGPKPAAQLAWQSAVPQQEQGISSGTAPCESSRDQGTGLGSRQQLSAKMCLQTTERVLGLLGSPMQLGLIVPGLSVGSAMSFLSSLSMLFTLYSRVLPGEIKQMLSGITFSCW